MLRSLTRAEYSPQVIGHYALASEQYCHFTSPIRRYADLTVHRLLDTYFAARAKPENKGGKTRAKKIDIKGEVPTYAELVELGKRLSYTERRSDDAERELRQVKLLELLGQHIGDEFPAVVSGITNFGVFFQLQTYLIDGLIRYERLMDDWWEVDDKAGFARGQRSGIKIGIGDACVVRVVRVDPARRELDLAVTHFIGKDGKPIVIAPPTGNRDGGGRSGGGGGRSGGSSGRREGGGNRNSGGGRGPVQRDGNRNGPQYRDGPAPREGNRAPMGEIGSGGHANRKPPAHKPAPVGGGNGRGGRSKDRGRRR